LTLTATATWPLSTAKADAERAHAIARDSAMECRSAAHEICVDDSFTATPVAVAVAVAVHDHVNVNG
jgi:hypothetical protein